MAAINDHLLSSKTKQTIQKNTGDIVDKWNACLPIRLESKTVENNPEFIKLLSVLAENVGPNGTSVAVQRDLNEAKLGLDREKQSFIQSHTLFSELEELLSDHELQLAPAQPSSNTQFYRAVRDLLTSTELSDYIAEESSVSDGGGAAAGSPTLLGLKVADLDVIDKNSRLIESIRQRIIPDIEFRLRHKCESLLDFYNLPLNTLTSAGDTGDKFMFAKATQLSALLEAEKQELESDEKRLKELRRSHDKQVSLYYQTLMDSLSILVKLLTQHRLKSQPSCDDITSESLAARCEAMRLKIKVLELQLLNDTYTVETTTALNTIRRELNLSIDDTQKELAQTTEALKTYETVGAEFDSLVQQFTKLHAEIDNKKWAVQELRRNERSSEKNN